MDINKLTPAAIVSLTAIAKKLNQHKLVDGVSGTSLVARDLVPDGKHSGRFTLDLAYDLTVGRSSARRGALSWKRLAMLACAKLGPTTMACVLAEYAAGKGKDTSETAALALEALQGAQPMVERNGPVTLRTLSVWADQVDAWSEQDEVADG